MTFTALAVPHLTFFSTQAITQLESVIQSKVDKVVEKLKFTKGEVLESMGVYGAFTTDIISHYTYGESFGFLDNDEQAFKNSYIRDISGFMKAAPYLMHYPMLNYVIMLIPDCVMAYLSSGMASMLEIVNTSKDYARKTLASRQDIKERKGSLDLKTRTIFDALSHPSIPARERSIARLTDEDVVIVVAGLESTGRFLTNITCHLLSNPEALEKLVLELNAAMGTPDTRLPWKALEKLPYLSAVILEDLRCEQIMTSRATRVIKEPVRYRDWSIHANTVLSAATYLLDNDPDVFPDPHVFRPERWLETRARGDNFQKYLATFGRGSRGCLGINLAYAELYLTTAAIVRNLNIELVDSSEKDVIAQRAFLLGFTKDYTFGIKTKITKVLEQ